MINSILTGIVIGIAMPLLVMLILFAIQQPLVASAWIGVVICLLIAIAAIKGIIHLIRIGPTGHRLEMLEYERKKRERFSCRVRNGKIIIGG